MSKQPKNALERAKAAMAAISSKPPDITVEVESLDSAETIIEAALAAVAAAQAAAPPVVAEEEAPKGVEVPEEFLQYPYRIAAARRNLTTFCKLGGHKYINPQEYERMCLIVAGDERRLIQRILLVLAQRSQMAGDVALRDQVRLYTMLHERESLLKHLALVV